MTRFWIRLDQGVEFVVHCASATRGGEIFVPKIPSMRMMDLVEAVAPGCHVEFIGIRPGEKLHELLMSEDESRQAVELDEMFAIEPIEPSWPFPAAASGKRPPPGFRYASDSNGSWLSLDAMRELIDG
jgi:UDP-N-acetylglucosamine 4,6-dehydratase